MATTSPDNLRTPDSGDSYALVQDMGILADTTQNALIKRANAYLGTVSQRNAFTSEAPTGTIWSDEDGDRLVWRKGATEWELVAPPRPKSISGYTVAASSANSAATTHVPFPPGFFTEPPIVVVSSNSSVIGSTLLGVAGADATTEGFNIVVRRTNNTNTGVLWIAMEEGEV